MPSPPEFGDAAGQEGISEVLREGEAEHASETDCHIAVAGEIVVDLEHVGECEYPVACCSKSL